MTLYLSLNEDAEQLDLIVDDHLILRAEKMSPTHIIYRNFDAVVDDRLHDALREVAQALLGLTNE